MRKSAAGDRKNSTARTDVRGHARAAHRDAVTAVRELRLRGLAVHDHPGHTTFTVMPQRASSRARALENAITPAFAAE